METARPNFSTKFPKMNSPPPPTAHFLCPDKSLPSPFHSPSLEVNRAFDKPGSFESESLSLSLSLKEKENERGNRSRVEIDREIKVDEVRGSYLLV